MPEMIYDWSREKRINTKGGIVKVEQLAVVEGGAKTKKIIPPFRPKPPKAVSRGYHKYDPLGHM